MQWSKSALYGLISFLLFPRVAFCESLALDQSLALSNTQLKHIGQKIYQNETGGNENYLISWNQGEAFASLGIGHFIWFPEGLESPFTESFPVLLAFFQEQGVKLPDWLTPDTDCPWQNKAQFTQAQNSNDYLQLRELLTQTFDLQVEFIQQRQQAALPKMLNQLESEKQQNAIRTLFTQLSQTPSGLYALIDYVNFKGEGTSPKERYKGKGWGLLQVLLRMSETLYPNDNIHQAFASACDQVLTRRVELSPQQDVESRWLAGWRNRCKTYSLAD